MLTQNDIKRKNCGLTEWHKRGLTGQGITVAVLDEWPFITDYMDREIYSAPLGVGEGITHGTWVAQVVHEAAPGAKIVMLPFFNSIEDRKKAIAWLKENPVDIINMSMKLSDSDWLWSELKAIALKSLIVAAAGNDGDDAKDIAMPARFDWTIGVGGIYENGTLQHCNTIGENMDCVAYTGVYAQNTKGSEIPFHGTSCAAPWLSGMLATYYTGQTVPPVGMVRELIKANSRDMEEAGKDRKSGWGFFVLPEKYQPAEVPEAGESEDENMEIVLQIGSHAAWVNGESVALDCAPFASQGRTFVPLRFIAEALGCQVDYKSKTGQITITK